MRKNSRGFVEILVLVALVIVALGAGVYFWSARNPGKNSQNPISKIQQTLQRVTPTPTPFPFQEMTIPYLRSRSFESNIGELQKVSENSAYTSYVTSFASDGFKVYGLLTKPKSERPSEGWPAIIFIHGYIPPEEYQTRVNYASYVDYLARSGFVVFKIDLRGNGDSEGEPGGGYYSGDYVIDTLNAYAALKVSDFINTQKIGLWGHSMAGNIVMRAFAAKPEIPAVVIWAGAGYTYTDLQDYSIQDTSYRPPPPDSESVRKRQLLRDTYGNFDENNWFWKQVPATNYLNDLKGAIQINHAVNDNVVSIEYSRNLARLLDAANISSELNEYPDGGHNLTGNSFNQAMQATVEFFKKNL